MKKQSKPQLTAEAELRRHAEERLQVKTAELHPPLLFIGLYLPWCQPRAKLFTSA